MRTVHGLNAPSSRAYLKSSRRNDGGHVGSGIWAYRCVFCAESGKLEPFMSPRKDNFRSHIKRKHSALQKNGEEAEAFLKRCEAECRVQNSHNNLSTFSQSEVSQSARLSCKNPAELHCGVEVHELRSEMQCSDVDSVKLIQKANKSISCKCGIDTVPAEISAENDREQERIAPASMVHTVEMSTAPANPALSATNRTDAPLHLEEHRRCKRDVAGLCPSPSPDPLQKQRLLKEKEDLEKRLQELNLLLGHAQQEEPAQAPFKAQPIAKEPAHSRDNTGSDLSLTLPPIDLTKILTAPKSPPVTGGSNRSDPFLSSPNTGWDLPPTPTEPVFTYSPSYPPLSGTPVGYLSPRPTPVCAEESRPGPTCLAGNFNSRGVPLESISSLGLPRPSALAPRGQAITKSSTHLKSQADHINKNSPAKRGGSDKRTQKCPSCNSSFALPCQLRKHLKRHAKPFGCTFAGCGKSFGAKNDWKRHENSQHHQLELWKCGLQITEGSGICGKCHYRKADFVRHLKTAHNILGSIPEEAPEDNFDPMEDIEREQARALAVLAYSPKETRTVKEIIKECHIPKNHAGQFWCGFCNKTIQLRSRGSDGWDERFDHIAEHFEKEKKRVSTEWTFCSPPEPNLSPSPGDPPPRTGTVDRWTCCKCGDGPLDGHYCEHCKSHGRPHERCDNCRYWEA